MDFEEIRKRSNEYIKGYADCLEYDVAKQEYQPQLNLNIADDFYQFKNEIAEKLGEGYIQQTEKFIQKYGDLHLPMKPYLLTDENFARNIQRHQDHNYQFIHFVFTMAEIYVQGNTAITTKDTVSVMKMYVKLGLNLVANDCLMGEKYRAQFENMKDQIKQIEWERD